MINAIIGGGEMGERIRTFDWSQTPLGPIETWPQSLMTAVRIMLTSRQPFWLGWGEQLIKLYNDPYKAIVGGKHPGALGQPVAVVWREIWEDIAPMLTTAMGGVEGTYVEAQLLIMERNGYPEETYYTFSYSPIPNDQGSAGGILCANTDDTQRVIGERQLALLRELAAKTADARTVEQACALSVDCLANNPYDLPFAMIYLVDPDARHVTLTSKGCGIERGHPAAPARVALDGGAVWPFAEVLATNRARLVSDLRAFANRLPTGAWDRPPHQGVVVPIAAQGPTGKAGMLVVGLNPYRLFDDQYRGFLELAAAQIAASIANAQAYEEARRRAEALAELDRTKTAFFSNVSHEFRTPLTLMLGPLDDLQQSAEALLPKQREQIDVAHRNALRLLRLVNTLLDFSRIEAGRMQATYEPTDLAAFTADLASVFRSTIERAGLRLVVTCPPLAELVYIDREMWEKIVFNLLSNAFKFTFAGEIEVALRPAGAMVELVVRDTGTGIPTDEVPHLFERFHRVKGARGRTFEGSGIGLALVQELVKLHGGTVHVASELDRGSTFVVALPLGAAHLSTDGVGAPRTLASTGLRGEAYIEEAQAWLPDDQRAEFQGLRTELGAYSETQPAALSPQSSARILLADDNADMRAYVGRLLNQEYEVIAVGDGAAALRAAQAHTPDLVLTDVMMPELDGFELIQALRADERLKTVPIILLSARAGEEARVEGMHAGADDYLVKPFSARELLAHVGAHLKMARIRDEAEQRLRASEAQYRALTELSPQFVFMSGPDGEITFVNQYAQEFTGRTLAELRGAGWAACIHPDARDRAYNMWRAATTQVTEYDDELPFLRADGAYRWLQARATPIVDDAGVVAYWIGIALDVTDRRVAEQALAERERLLGVLLNVSDAARELSDEVDIARAACRLVKGELRASSCSCGFVYPEQDRVLIVADICDTDAGVPNIEGEWQLSSFGPGLIALLAQGNPVVIEDTASHPATAAFHQTAYATKHVRSLVSIPLVRDGRLVAYVSIHDRAPRRYTAAEVLLLRDVAVRVWEAIQRSRAEISLRASEAHQSLLLRLTQGQRETNDPNVMVADAAEALGRSLRADRVGFFEMYDHDTLAFGLSWVDGRLPALEGLFPAAGIGARYLAEMQAGRMLGIADTINDPLTSESVFGRLGARAIICAPIIRNGRWHAGLYVNHSHARQWTDDEMTLVRDVAEQTWDAIERARARTALNESEARLQMLYAQEQAARAQAEEASRLKDEFLATVSHELRTPLTAFLGYAQMVQRRQYDQTYVERTVEKLVRSAQSQAQIIEDLLDVSRIVNGKMHIEAQPVDLAVVIHAALDTVRPAVEAKQLHLQLDLRPDAGTIIGDPNRLQQVVWNLLANAAKFTPSGGGIQVGLERSGYDTLLTVSDTGPGISAAFLPYVFDRFRQADSTSNRAHGGLGLGLAIVRHLVELHGGTVQVASAGAGQGATFTVRLPIVSDAMAAPSGMASSVPDALSGDDECSRELDGLRILMVDDQPDILELLHEILVPCGAVVRLCNTARDALETARAWQPDLLVSDIAMPGEDGYWLIHHIRAFPPDQGGAIPAIALTAYVRMEERLRVLAAGFQLYVPKPVEPAELRNVVARLARTVATD